MCLFYSHNNSSHMCNTTSHLWYSLWCPRSPHLWRHIFKPPGRCKVWRSGHSRNTIISWLWVPSSWICIITTPGSKISSNSPVLFKEIEFSMQLLYSPWHKIFCKWHHTFSNLINSTTFAQYDKYNFNLLQVGETFPFRNMYGVIDSCRECECLAHEESQCYIKQECYTTAKPTTTLKPCIDGCMLSDGQCVPVSSKHILTHNKLETTFV